MVSPYKLQPFLYFFAHGIQLNFVSSLTENQGRTEPSISAFIFETHLISLKIISLMPGRQHTNVPPIFGCSSHLNISKLFKSLDDQFYDLLNSLCIHPTLSPEITHGPAKLFKMASYSAGQGQNLLNNQGMGNHINNQAKP